MEARSCLQAGQLPPGQKRHVRMLLPGTQPWQRVAHQPDHLAEEN